MNILESADVQDRRERDSSVEIPDSEHVVTGGNEQHLWWERAASLVCSISWTSWLGVSGLFIQHIRLTYDKLTELNDVVFCEFILDLFPEQFNLLLTEVKWIDFSTQNHFLIICGKLVQVSDRMKSGATQGAEKKYSWGDAGKVLMVVRSRSWKPKLEATFRLFSLWHYKVCWDIPSTQGSYRSNLMI